MEDNVGVNALNNAVMSKRHFTVSLWRWAMTASHYEPPFQLWRMMTNDKSMYLALTNINVDPACQARAAMDDATINEYVEIMKEEADDPFPAVVVYHDGTEHWLSDGFHRYAAAEKVGLRSLKVEIRQGSRRDAILHGAGANATHGLPRSNEDKRSAVAILLGDPEWAKWSDAKIAEHCKVSDRFVAKQRRNTPNGSESTVRKYTNPKTGQTTEMNVSNIGHRSGDAKSPEVSVSDPDVSVQPGEVSDPLEPAPDLVEGSPEHSEPKTCDTDAQLDALLVAWDHAGSETRAQFLDLIEAVPVGRPTEKKESESGS